MLVVYDKWGTRLLMENSSALSNDDKVQFFGDQWPLAKEIIVVLKSLGHNISKF